MPFRIEKGREVFTMDKNHSALLTVPGGAVVSFVTRDCFGDQIQGADTPFDSLDWNCVNPVAGPLFVEGAAPGDILRVDIQKIELKSKQAIMLTGPQLGIVGEDLEEMSIRVLPLNFEEGLVEFSEKVKVPFRPMIGVIGVAPAGEAISCGTPGEHGGNMDCKEIVEGATLYLPVQVEGALLSLGDLHAAMGDGEVCCSGAEVPGEVTLKVDVLKGAPLPSPFIKNDSTFMTLASAKSAEEAIKAAGKKGLDFLVKNFGFIREEALFFLSLGCDVRICQVVDPLITARMEIPRKLLLAYPLPAFLE